MMVMKTSCVITILHLMSVPLVLFGAKSVPLPALPCGELPNSEVVTNVVLNVDYGRLENLTFSLELNASASNSISIAVGTAAGDALTRPRPFAHPQTATIPNVQGVPAG